MSEITTSGHMLMLTCHLFGHCYVLSRHTRLGHCSAWGAVLVRVQLSSEHTIVQANSEYDADSHVVMQELADQCDMFTGAELAGLCREAAITALREDLQVSAHDFDMT